MIFTLGAVFIADGWHSGGDRDRGDCIDGGGNHSVHIDVTVVIVVIVGAGHPDVVVMWLQRTCLVITARQDFKLNTGHRLHNAEPQHGPPPPPAAAYSKL